MASTLDFRAQLTGFLQVLFFGGGQFFANLTGETWSSYSDEIRSRRLNFIAIGTREEYPSLLSPGELAFQARCWQIREGGFDSNVTYQIMGIEVVVHRAISKDEIENIYTGGYQTPGNVDDLRSQMLEHQALLVSRSNWLGGPAAPAALDLFIEGPTIDSPPVRVDNLISYTVTAEVQIKPD